MNRSLSTPAVGSDSHPIVGMRLGGEGLRMNGLKTSADFVDNIPPAGMRSHFEAISTMWYGQEEPKWIASRYHDVPEMKHRTTKVHPYFIGEETSRLQPANSVPNLPTSSPHANLAGVPTHAPLSFPGAHHKESVSKLGSVDTNYIPQQSRRCEKLHLRQEPSGQEVYDLPRGLKIVKTPLGGRLHHVHSQETLVEQMMGHKKPISETMRRNGIPLAAGGDKDYKFPDYKPGFFTQKPTGLTVGSTFVKGSFTPNQRLQ